MSKDEKDGPKIFKEEAPKPVEAPKPIEAPKPTEAPKVTKEPMPDRKRFKNTQPFNWNIQPLGDGIEAFNSGSGERFEGSVEEFNKLMRG